MVAPRVQSTHPAVCARGGHQRVRVAGSATPPKGTCRACKGHTQGSAICGLDPGGDHRVGMCALGCGDGNRHRGYEGRSRQPPDVIRLPKPAWYTLAAASSGRCRTSACGQVVRDITHPACSPHMLPSLHALPSPCPSALQDLPHDHRAQLAFLETARRHAPAPCPHPTPQHVDGELPPP